MSPAEPDRIASADGGADSALQQADISILPCPQDAISCVCCISHGSSGATSETHIPATGAARTASARNAEMSWKALRIVTTLHPQPFRGLKYSGNPLQPLKPLVPFTTPTPEIRWSASPPFPAAASCKRRPVRKSFQMLLRRGYIWDVEAFKAMPEDSPERQMDLLRMLEREDYPGEAFLSEEALDYFTETFEITGFTGGLNWYRMAGRPLPGIENAKWEIDVPCLYIGAENDVILRPSSADGMEDFIDDFEKYTVADCGHWTQQEKPEETNRVLIDWLRRKIAKTA